MSVNHRVFGMTNQCIGKLYRLLSLLAKQNRQGTWGTLGDFGECYSIGSPIQLLFVKLEIPKNHFVGIMPVTISFPPSVVSSKQTF